MKTKFDGREKMFIKKQVAFVECEILKKKDKRLNTLLLYLVMVMVYF